MKGGDYRSREANVYRLAQVSVDIIDQCVAQGVPFAREYGGLLDNRSFGGAQVSRTFYAGARPVSSCCSARTRRLMRQVHAGNVDALPAYRDARPRRQGRPHRGHRVPRPRHAATCSRCRVTRSCSRPAATATSSTCRRTPRTRTSPPRGERRSGARTSPTPATRRSTPRAFPASDDFQSKLTLMSESLRNDGRIWVPKQIDDTRPRRPDPRSRPRLPPRAPLPGVRQPRRPRRRVARDQARGRRRARRRPAEERRVPRPRRRRSNGSART